MTVEVLREQHEAPDHIQSMLALAGGLNRFGRPNYRFAWGWSRLGFIGGEWSDFDRSGNLIRRVVELRLVPKYSMLNRWHLERWCPPEMYGSPQMWAMETLERTNGITVPALGPYPQFGEYEHALTLDESCPTCEKRHRAAECEHRRFVNLTTGIAFRCARAIEFSRDLKESERRAAIDRRQQWEAMQDEKAIDDILDSDPAEIPVRRQQYLDHVIAPQLDQAIANAHKRKQVTGNRFSGYKVTAENPRPVLVHK